MPSLRLLVVGLGTLVVPLDSSVNVAFPYIVGHFDLPIPMIEWVVIAYVLTYASLMLIFGRFGDVFGHRQVFLFGAAWSAAAFLLCSLAPSYPWLLAARTMQGVGAALLLSCGAAIATGLFPERLRAKVLGVYTMMFGLGGALGPPLAGLLVEQWGWRAVFGFRVPICVIAFLLALMLPKTPRSGAGEPFDGVGALLLAASVSAGLLALNELQHLPQAFLPLLLLATIA
ncbi:MAG: MFS transporter, partial [Pseudomonadota bacterium]